MKVENKLLDDILKVSTKINSHYGAIQPIVMMGNNKEEHDINYNKMLNHLIKVLETNGD